MKPRVIGVVQIVLRKRSVLGIQKLLVCIPLSLFIVELKNYLRIFQLSRAERLCAIRRSCDINHSVGSRRLAAGTRARRFECITAFCDVFLLGAYDLRNDVPNKNTCATPSGVNNALEQGTRNELVRETIN